MPDRSFDYQTYFEHGMTPTAQEVEMRDALNVHLPGVVIDSHVHASTVQSFDANRMNDFTWNHMVSTYPVTTLEQSAQISDLMMPGIEVRKLRFAHAFRGIAHRSVNQYLIENSPAADRVALFGVSDTPEEIEYTINELSTEQYSALKMYYSAGREPVYDLYQYFPKDILAKAQEVDVPIILHLPNSLERSMGEIDVLSRDFPDLRVVLAHIGVTWIDDEGLDDLFARLSHYKNIVVDTSGAVDIQVIEKALRHLGVDRVMFGSDEPLNLLREQTYHNPELGPRIISDFPYHWVNKHEYERFKDTVPTPRYSHLQQIESLLTAIDNVATDSQDKQQVTQAVFHDNAYQFFDFSDHDSANK